MSQDLTDIDLTQLQPILETYGAIPGSLITILQKTQEIYGYLPQKALAEISAKTKEPPAKIQGIATFYTQFRLQPIGKYLFMLCKGTACHVNGADLLGMAITDEIGIEDGETTPDGLFTLKYVACLGCCSLSPAMMVNGEVYGNLTQEKVRTILHQLQKKEAE